MKALENILADLNISGKKGKDIVTAKLTWAMVFNVSNISGTPLEFAKKIKKDEAKDMSIAKLLQTIIYRYVTKHEGKVLKEVTPEMVGLTIAEDVPKESRDNKVLTRLKAIILDLAHTYGKNTSFADAVDAGKFKQILEDPLYGSQIKKKTVALEADKEHKDKKSKGIKVAVEEGRNKGAASSSRSGSADADSGSEGDSS